MGAITTNASQPIPRMGALTTTPSQLVHTMGTVTMGTPASTDYDVGIFCPGVIGNSTPGYCGAYFDQILCWPETPADSFVYLPCPNFQDDTATSIYKAHRFCPTNATWDNTKTNYSMCIEEENKPQDGQRLIIAHALRDIYFIISTISLVLLLLTLFIFQYFRSLQCSRISIHKHLVVSFIFQFIIIIIMTEPYITNRPTSYRDEEVLCKIITAVSQYSILTGMFWMFVEGFFLHHSLVLGVFSTQTPFKWFYFTGWGLPAVIVTAWAIMLHYTLDTPCWQEYSEKHSFKIITIPFTLAIVFNLIFLINIIRVLVAKLRANNRVESANIRKAIKATVILMPLLGLTNLLFFTNPSKNDHGFESAYQLTNAVLRSSQGIFVSVLYCFVNGEVRRVIKQKWYRFKIRHVMHTSNRRRSSRTSSFFLTSATEVHPLRALKNKMCPDLGRETITDDMTSMNNRYTICTLHTCTPDKADIESQQTQQKRTRCPCTCSWTHKDEMCHCGCDSDPEEEETQE